MTEPRRGEIHLVAFDPTLGAEIRKTRPALVVQNDSANRYSPITIVAAVTSSVDDRRYPTEVLIRAPEAGLLVDSIVLLNQIRSIDRRRLVKRLGRVDPPTIEAGRAGPSAEPRPPRAPCRTSMIRPCPCGRGRGEGHDVRSEETVVRFVRD